MGGLTWHLHRAVSENRTWPSSGEEFRCCQSSPETPLREKVAFYCSQRVIPPHNPCFGTSLVSSQLCTYSCSSGSWQTSLTRNANIALAGTPKSAVIFCSTNPPFPPHWDIFLDLRLFSPKLLPLLPAHSWWVLPSTLPSQLSAPWGIHTSEECLECSVPWDCSCCITGRFIYARKQQVSSRPPVWFKTHQK